MPRARLPRHASRPCGSTLRLPSAPMLAPTVLAALAATLAFALPAIAQHAPSVVVSANPYLGFAAVVDGDTAHVVGGFVRMRSPRR